MLGFVEGRKADREYCRVHFIDRARSLDRLFRQVNLALWQISPVRSCTT
jgi:hypothetical protein